MRRRTVTFVVIESPTSKEHDHGRHRWTGDSGGGGDRADTGDADNCWRSGVGCAIHCGCFEQGSTWWLVVAPGWWSSKYASCCRTISFRRRSAGRGERARALNGDAKRGIVGRWKADGEGGRSIFRCQSEQSTNRSSCRSRISSRFRAAARW